MPTTNVPIWATTIAAGAMPVLLIALTQAIAPRGTQPRRYEVLVVLGCLVWFLIPVTGAIIGLFVDPIANPILRALAKGVLFAIPDLFFQLLPFFIWLAAIRRREAHDCLYGAVMSAMTVEMVGNFFLFQKIAAGLAGGLDDWLQFVAVRSALLLPSEALSAFAVGMWMAIVLADVENWRVRRLVGAFAVVLLADGVWSTGTYLRGDHASSPAVWLPLLCLSVLVRGGVVVVAARELARRGNRLSLPRWSRG